MRRTIAAVLLFCSTLAIIPPANATADPALDAKLGLPAAAAKSDEDRLFWLRNAGKVANARGERDKAVLAWRAALPLSEKLNGPASAETEAVLFELGLALYQAGDIAGALPVFRRDYELRSALFGAESSKALVALSNVASCYIVLGDAQGALPVQERILKIGTKARGESDPDVLIDRNNLASTQRQLGHFREAEANWREIIRLRRARGDDGEDMRTAAGNLAALLNLSGRSEEVEAALESAGLLDDAKTPATDRGFDSAMDFVRGQLARAYDALGKPEPALAIVTPIVGEANATLGPAHPETIGFASDLSRYALDAAILQSDPTGPAFRDRAAQSLAAARQAASGLAQRTSALGFSQAAEQALGGDSFLREQTYAQLAVAAIQVARNAPAERVPELRNEALQAIQRAMDGTASRAVAETAARNAAAAQGLAPLVEARQDLADRWQDNEAALTAATGRQDAQSAAERTQLTAERARLEAQLAEADASLRERFPAYFALIRPEPLTEAEATKLVKPDEAVLLILPTKRSVQVMTITSDGIAWLASSLSEDEVEQMVRRLMWDVGGNVEVTPAEEAQWSDEGAGAYPFDRKTAYRLWQELVEPSMGELAGKRHVFVIAGGALSSLPFSLLVTAPPEGADGDPAVLRATKWFADTAALIQLPSLQSLAFLRATAPPTPGQAHDELFLGFGDPALEGRAETRGGRGAGGTRRRTGQSVSRGSNGLLTLEALRRMVRLPGTATELEAMRQALAARPAQVFTGPRATESNFRHADLADARVIALATHGLLAGELAGSAEPGLVFTPPSTPSMEDDGYLSASEIAALRLNADWVILSACNTAAGSGKQGAPGLSGLARAFFYAGAQSLLASHWPVRDDVAAKLTVRSIEIRRDNPSLSRAEALQQAMREIRNDPSADSEDDTWAHPSAWAPFTLVGDGTR